MTPTARLTAGLRDKEPRTPVRNTLHRTYPINQGKDGAERVFIVGKSGSGKTQLAKLLLSNFQDVICLDPKCTLRIPGFRIITDPKKLNSVKRGENIIFRPPHNWGLTEYEAFFRWIYLRKRTTLYIDEIYAVANASLQPTSWLGAIATRGREIGISLWVATQRPVSVPNFLVSEAEWVFCFRLKLPQDKKKIEEVAEERLAHIVGALKKYEFICVSSVTESISRPTKLIIPVSLQNKAARK